MTPVVLRPGMIYARGVLMPDAARWLSRRRLLAVWNQPTWIHLLSLQEFLDRAAECWGGAWPWRRGHRPWRAPAWAFYAAAALTEAFAAVFRTRAPLTRDFIEGARSPW